jgi:hypothetical protein
LTPNPKLQGFEKDMTWKIDNSETAFPEEAKVSKIRVWV